ncbi:MAG: hypothetical protein ACPG4X_14620 [Pikeienuella sp.]
MAKRLTMRGLQRRISALDDRIAALEKTQFRLFDGLLHDGKPDLSSQGLMLVNVIYEHELWPGLPREERTWPNLKQATVERLAVEASNGNFTSIDLEAFANESEANKILYFNTVTNWFQGAYTGPELSHYAYLPAWRDDWHNGEGTAEHAAWQAKNTARMIDVTAFSPEFYVRSASPEYEAVEWERRALMIVEECRRLDPEAEVVPYIWFNYTSNAGLPPGSRIPADFWRKILRVVGEICDGAILWGGFTEQWDPTERWWVDTRKFLRRAKRHGGINR